MKLTQQDFTPAIMLVEDAPTDTDLKIRVSYWTGNNEQQNAILFHDTIIPEIVKRFNAHEDLLDACEATLQVIETDHPDLTASIKRLRATINKAKGNK